jgi:hypothetical protein
MFRLAAARIAAMAKVLSGFGPRGKAFRDAILAAYTLSPAETELLDQAARTVDLLAAMDAELATSKMTVLGSTKQLRPHPLLASVAEQRRVLTRLVDALGLPMPGEDEGTRNQAQRRAAQQRWSNRRRTVG